MERSRNVEGEFLVEEGAGRGRGEVGLIAGEGDRAYLFVLGIVAVRNISSWSRLIVQTASFSVSVRLPTCLRKFFTSAAI